MDPKNRCQLHAAVRALCATLLVVFTCDRSMGQVNCWQPAGSTRIDASYNPSSTGQFWLMSNYQDTGSNSAVPPYTPGGPDGKINSNDTFIWEEGGLPKEAPDPTVMKLSSQYGTWWYISFTHGHFPIYRTRDFKHFEFHMWAFDVANLAGSNQWWDGGNQRMYVNGVWFSTAWAPHLYVDPTQTVSDNQLIYMSWTGTYQSTNPDLDSSVYLSTIRRSDFLSWHTRNPSQDGPRFDDNRNSLYGPMWYYNHPTNGAFPYYYDGGYAAGRLVPTSGAPSILAGPNCGQLLQRQRGQIHRCQGAAPRMTLDTFVFFDPKRLEFDPLKRMMLYTWWDANSNIPFSEWGNHVACNPLLANHIQLDSSWGLQHLALGRNATAANKINGMDNGAVDRWHGQWNWGAVAEGPTAIYLPQTDRYYVIYSRNVWDSAAYQMVYRMTEPGAAFSTLYLNWFNTSVQEHILLRADNPTAGGSSGVAGASFGGGEVFTITGEDGTVYPYIAFHGKLDYDVNPNQHTQRRTFFVKELTADLATGKLVQLGQTATDPKADIRVFRLPRCRQ